MIRRREFLGLGALALAWPRLGFGGETLLAHMARPQDWATPTEYFDRLITPTPVFFVRSHFGPPALRPDRRLTIDGLVDKPLELGAADLKTFEEVTLTGVLQCSGNGRALSQPRVPGVQWEHGAMGQATWTGVRLKDLLERVGVQAGAAHLRIVGADLPPKPAVPSSVQEAIRLLTELLARKPPGEPAQTQAAGGEPDPADDARSKRSKRAR